MLVVFSEWPETSPCLRRLQDSAKEDLKIEKECYQLDTTASELSIEKYKVSSNSIIVRIIASDEESGIKTIEYVINNKTKGIEDKKSIKTVDETYLFEDLDKKYRIWNKDKSDKWK